MPLFITDESLTASLLCPEPMSRVKMHYFDTHWRLPFFETGVVVLHGTVDGAYIGDLTGGDTPRFDTVSSNHRWFEHPQFRQQETGHDNISSISHMTDPPSAVRRRKHRFPRLNGSGPRDRTTKSRGTFLLVPFVVTSASLVVTSALLVVTRSERRNNKLIASCSVRSDARSPERSVLVPFVAMHFVTSRGDSPDQRNR